MVLKLGWLEITRCLSSGKVEARGDGYNGPHCCNRYYSAGLLYLTFKYIASPDQPPIHQLSSHSPRVVPVAVGYHRQNRDIQGYLGKPSLNTFHFRKDGMQIRSAACRGSTIRTPPSTHANPMLIYLQLLSHNGPAREMRGSYLYTTPSKCIWKYSPRWYGSGFVS